DRAARRTGDDQPLRLPGQVGPGQLLGLVVQAMRGGVAGDRVVREEARREPRRPRHQLRGQQRRRERLHPRVRADLGHGQGHRRPQRGLRRPRLPGVLPGRSERKARPDPARADGRAVPERAGGTVDPRGDGEAMRRLTVTLVAAIACAALLPAAAAAANASLPDIEDEVMCTICGTTLQLSDSPQAERERVFINELIAEGKTKDEIKAALVDEYGPEVLAAPSDDGFDLVGGWILPVVAVLAGAT